MWIKLGQGSSAELPLTPPLVNTTCATNPYPCAKSLVQKSICYAHSSENLDRLTPNNDVE
jgi:hypothetical protein